MSEKKVLYKTRKTCPTFLSRFPKMKKRTMKVGCGVIILSIIIGKYFFVPSKRDVAKRYFHKDYCERQINRASNLIRRIEKFKRKRGRYPDNLKQLKNIDGEKIAPPIEHPYNQGEDRWYYERDWKNNEFTLMAMDTTWINDYNGLIYKSSQEYPKSWEKYSGVYNFEVKDWVYVVNAGNVPDLYNNKSSQPLKKDE